MGGVNFRGGRVLSVWCNGWFYEAALGPPDGVVNDAGPPTRDLHPRPLTREFAACLSATTTPLFTALALFIPPPSRPHPRPHPRPRPHRHTPPPNLIPEPAQTASVLFYSRPEEAEETSYSTGKKFIPGTRSFGNWAKDGVRPGAWHSLRHPAGGVTTAQVP